MSNAYDVQYSISIILTSSSNTKAKVSSLLCEYMRVKTKKKEALYIQSNINWALLFVYLFFQVHWKIVVKKKKKKKLFWNLGMKWVNLFYTRQIVECFFCKWSRILRNFVWCCSCFAYVTSYLPVITISSNISETLKPLKWTKMPTKALTKPSNLLLSINQERAEKTVKRTAIANFYFKLLLKVKLQILNSKCFNYGVLGLFLKVILF